MMTLTRAVAATTTGAMQSTFEARSSATRRESLRNRHRNASSVRAMMMYDCMLFDVLD